jgi:hypothetical protein
VPFFLPPQPLTPSPSVDALSPPGGGGTGGSGGSATGMSASAAAAAAASPGNSSGAHCPGAAYVREHPDLLDRLLDGYGDPAIALNCGQMFRDCVRDEPTARLALASPRFADLFSLAEAANFEVASDAFASFRDLLTRHKAAVAQHLAEHYADFFAAYAGLLRSSNYVTRRQSLKLLGELLLDRSNVRLAMRYVSDARNLMVIMNLLRDPSRSIQFEAFHVFKVFVANPAKPRGVSDILATNRAKLLRYLEDFCADKEAEDEQFREEKAVVLREIAAVGGSGGEEAGGSAGGSAGGAAVPAAVGDGGAVPAPAAAAAAAAPAAPPPAAAAAASAGETAAGEAAAGEAAAGEAAAAATTAAAAPLEVPAAEAVPAQAPPPAPSGPAETPAPPPP